MNKNLVISNYKDTLISVNTYELTQIHIIYNSFDNTFTIFKKFDRITILICKF